MNDWWKDPRLDDDGTYDYLAEELPKDYARWELTKETWRCDTCGKHRHLMLYSAHHFYCWDGWDSMSYKECLRCRLDGAVRYIKWKYKNKIKNSIEIIKLTIELYQDSNKSFKHCYNLAKALVR